MRGWEVVANGPGVSFQNDSNAVKLTAVTVNYSAL